jgi:hypothetical protein
MELKLFLDQFLDVFFAFLNTGGEQANYCVEVSVVAKYHLNFTLHVDLILQLP